jgi:hypothetical protein
VFTDLLHGDACRLRFVAKEADKRTVRPLMQALTGFLVGANPLPYAFQVSDHSGRDTSLKEHLHQFSGQLVQQVSDLVVDVTKLAVFGLR